MMELTIRDWMVIIGVLLIMAVLLDAWRRVRRDTYSRVKVKLAEPKEEGSERDAELSWLKELPNGGARTVRRDDLLRAAGHLPPKDAPSKHQPDAAPQAPETRNIDSSASDEKALEGETAEEPDSVSNRREVPLVEGFSSSESTDPENLDWLDGTGAAQGSTIVADDPTAPGRLPRDIDPEVFMLNVVARDPRGFRGGDILHILLACDLRFGDMNFFHRHEFEAGKGAIQFSVANMMQPGVFDIDNMSDFNTPGLVFFLTLPGPEEMMKAFDYMLETAQAVSRNLGGDVLDESRSVLTKQTMEHSRQQIRDLERRMLARTS